MKDDFLLCFICGGSIGLDEAVNIHASYNTLPEPDNEQWLFCHYKCLYNCADKNLNLLLPEILKEE